MNNNRLTNIKCVQINLCRSKHASTQLINFIENNNISIAFIQEPYTVRNKVCGFPVSYELIYSSTGEKPKSAVLIKKSRLVALNINSFSNNCITVCNIKFAQKKVLFVSAYCPPNSDLTVQLKHIQTTIDKIKPTYYLIAIDSNAHSNTWYDRKNDLRGYQLIDFIANNNILILNNNINNPTFVSHRGQSSIDLTLINDNFAPHTKNWTLLDIDSQSDHKYIILEIEDKMTEIQFKSTLKYNTKKADWNSLLNDFEPVLRVLGRDLNLINNCEQM